MSQFILSAFADEVDTDLDTQMNVLDQHGIKHIEMRGVNGQLLVNCTLDEARDIKRAIDARGFRLSAVGSPLGKIGITDDFEPHLELFKHTVEITQLMECQYIRMFSFYIPKGENPASYRNEVIDRWGQFVQAAEGSGLVLLHENEHGIYGDIPERCLDLVQSLQTDTVKLIFDFANFVQCGVNNYPDAYELLRHHIAYIHVKDALRTSGAVVPAGDGDGHVKEILEQLDASGYEGFLSLEPHLWSYNDFSRLQPDSPGYALPEGPAKRFAVAVHAIKKLVQELQSS